MSQQFLDRANVITVFKQMTCSKKLHHTIIREVHYRFIYLFNGEYRCSKNIDFKAVFFIFNINLKFLNCKYLPL